MAIGASTLALSAAVATAETASADPATPVQETPAPGWSDTPVEEKCVVRDPGGNPVIFELEGVEFEDDEHRPVDQIQYRPVDQVVPAPDGAEPDRAIAGGGHLRPAPEPGCDGAPVLEPELLARPQ